jgi:hypothetical protein
VPGRYRQSAAAVLARYERAAGGEWRCGDCGESNAATFESCWSCGKGATA